MPNPICPNCFSRFHRNGCPNDDEPDICHEHGLELDDCPGCAAHAAMVIKTEPLFITVTDDHDAFVDWVVEESSGNPGRAAGLFCEIQQNPYLVIREWRMSGGPPYSNEVGTLVLHCCRRCDALDREEWRCGEKAEIKASVVYTNGPLCYDCAADEAYCYALAVVA